MRRLLLMLLLAVALYQVIALLTYYITKEKAGRTNTAARKTGPGAARRAASVARTASGAAPVTPAAPVTLKAVPPSLPAQGQFERFTVYRDQGSAENHFTPYGLMGDIGDIRIVTSSNERPHSGKTCIKIRYNGNKSRNEGWSGVYWQQPANNWGGDKRGGYNLTGAASLTFWARGENGGEQIAEFKVGGISGAYADSDTRSSGPVTLGAEWRRYTIDLRGADLSNVIGGFCWVANQADNPGGFVMYLDDIAYE